MSIPATFTVTSAGRTAAWTRLDGSDTPETAVDTLAGGILLGDPYLVSRVRAVIEEGSPDKVKIAVPDGYYQFTPGRDTDADMAAALLVAGGPQAMLDASAWDTLHAAAFCDDDEDDEDAGIVY